VAHHAEAWIKVRDATINRRRRHEVAAHFKEYFAGAT